MKVPRGSRDRSICLAQCRSYIEPFPVSTRHSDFRTDTMGSPLLSLLLLAAPLVRASPRPARHERRSEAVSEYGRRVAIPGLEQRGYSAYMKAAVPFEQAAADEGETRRQSR